MRLGGEVHHSGGLVLRERRLHGVAIADVGLEERDPRLVDAGQTQQAAGVGEFVDDDDGVLRVREHVPYEVRADESGSAGDEDSARASQRRPPDVAVPV